MNNEQWTMNNEQNKRKKEANYNKINCYWHIKLFKKVKENIIIKKKEKRKKPW